VCSRGSSERKPCKDNDDSYKFDHPLESIDEEEVQESKLDEKDGGENK
jgi:hypothetical protein